MGKKIFSGVQPTGNLHLGNYLGAIKNFVNLDNDNENDCIFCVVDLHAITVKQDPKELRSNIQETVATFIASGIIGTLIMVIALQFFRNTPNDINLLPYGAEEVNQTNDSKNSNSNTFSINLQNIVYKTNAFWSLMNIHFLGCVGHAVILIGLVPLMTSKGISYTDSVFCLTLIMIVSMTTRFITPILGDGINPKIIMFIAFLGQGLFVIPWAFTDSKWMFYLVGILWSIPYGGEGTLFPIMNRKYYGFFPMDTTYGWQIFAASLGMALGGFIPGLVFDVTGGYELAIWISAFFSCFGAVVILTLDTTKEVLSPSFDNLQ